MNNDKTKTSRNLAAIDIGSNAVRLMIKSATTENGATTLRKLLFLRVPLRLGADVFSDGRISGTKARKLERLMKAYRQLMKIYDVTDYLACATSAMRDASNGMQTIADIADDVGLRISIITGEEEARLIYQCHSERQEMPGEDYLYVDVGGGSTEVTLVVDGKIHWRNSYDIGTLRWLEGKVTDERLAGLRKHMELLRSDRPLHIVGSGGNINKLYRLTENAGRVMTVAELAGLATVLESLTVEERAERFRLKADRADVIVPAAKIFLLIARAIEATDIQVPTISLGDGLIDSMVYKDGNV